MVKQFIRINYSYHSACWEEVNVTEPRSNKISYKQNLIAIFHYIKADVLPVLVCFREPPPPPSPHLLRIVSIVLLQYVYFLEVPLANQRCHDVAFLMLILWITFSRFSKMTWSISYGNITATLRNIYLP